MNDQAIPQTRYKRGGRPQQSPGLPVYGNGRDFDSNISAAACADEILRMRPGNDPDYLGDPHHGARHTGREVAARGTLRIQRPKVALRESMRTRNGFALTLPIVSRSGTRQADYPSERSIARPRASPLFRRGFARDQGHMIGRPQQFGAPQIGGKPILRARGFAFFLHSIPS